MDNEQILEFLKDEELKDYIGEEATNYLKEHLDDFIPCLKGTEEFFDKQRVKQLIFAIAVSRFIYEHEDIDELYGSYEGTTDYVECLTNKL